MSKQSGNKTLSIVGISIGILLIPAAAAIGFSINSGCNSGTANACGAEAASSINPAPTSPLYGLLLDLNRYSNPDTFLSTNSVSLEEISTSISSAISSITNPVANSAYASIQNKDQVLSLLQKMLTDIQFIQQNVQSNRQSTVSYRDDFLADLKQLQQLIPFGGTALPVPAVTENINGFCGHTSMMMVMLYYTKGVVNDYMSQYVTTRGSGGFISSGPNSPVVTPSSLNDHTNGATSGWDFANAPSSADAMYTMIKKSIDGGDPVILYTYGAIYHASANHIVVVVGYDDKDQHLIINNPATIGMGDTEVATKYPNHSKATGGLNDMGKDWVFSHLGQSFYGHSFIMRTKYL